MSISEILTLIIAVLGAAVALANSTDEGRARIGRWAKFAITQAVFLVFVVSSVYNIVSFFGKDGPPSRSEVGMLILNVINALAWADAWLSSSVRAYFRLSKKGRAAD